MPHLNAIGIVTSDMAESIRFYRALGLDVPETPDEGHVETFLPNGVRFMLDSEETMHSFIDAGSVGTATRSRSPSSARAPPRSTRSTRV